MTPPHTAAEAHALLDGITAEPWALSLIHGVPMLYGADGVTPVAFTIYEETASTDGCPEADANAALIAAAPDLARSVVALTAQRDAAVDALSAAGARLTALAGAVRAYLAADDGATVPAEWVDDAARERWESDRATLDALLAGCPS